MSSVRTYSWSSEDGFSLTELLVSVSLLAMVIGGAYMALAAVNAMTDSVMAHQQASLAGTIAVERIASDIREGWSPTYTSGIPFRTRTATMTEFYLDPQAGDDRRQIVKYYTSADASGTFTLYRATGSTTTAVGASSITQTTPFTYGAPSVVSKGLTTNSLFTYYRQVAGLPQATASLPPSSVQIRIVTKATVGRTTATSTNITLAQMRTTYDYTSP
jgi:prepilin-type N-terminal cleavage/methylation domain-containing protein